MVSHTLTAFEGAGLRVYDGLPAEEAAAVDLWFPSEIGLAEHLSPNRANGLDAMQRAIATAAQAG